MSFLGASQEKTEVPTTKQLFSQFSEHLPVTSPVIVKMRQSLTKGRKLLGFTAYAPQFFFLPNKLSGLWEGTDSQNWDPQHSY